MSRLDLLSQTAPRLVDAHSRNASIVPDAQEGSGTAANHDFGSLLEGFSGRSQKESIAASQQEGSLLNIMLDEPASDLAGTDADSLQALLPDVTLNVGVTDMAVFQTVSPVYSILENLLPRILSQAGNGRATDVEQQDASLASADLTMPQQDTDETNLLKSGLGSRLSVTVQNQETHFKPIVEGLNVASTETAAASSDESATLPSKDMLAGRFKEDGAKSLQMDRHSITKQALNDTTAEAVVAKKVEEQETVSKVSFDRLADRAEMQKQSSVAGSKAEAGTLPPATLQHIAGAILDDAKGLSETQHSGFHSDGLNRVATAKASGGVLRVLNLQLKPAELGLVTIKMRLSGDNLEMEIQAETEETAELLRNDAEKLSNLLRGSGYRPDVINIQSAEASSHDRSLFNRSQQGTQAQGQSFQQGAAGGQGESSRHREGQYQGTGSKIHHDTKEDPAAGGGRSGGIYL